MWAVWGIHNQELRTVENRWLFYVVCGKSNSLLEYELQGSMETEQRTHSSRGVRR